MESNGWPGCLGVGQPPCPSMQLAFGYSDLNKNKIRKTNNINLMESHDWTFSMADVVLKLIARPGFNMAGT